MFNFLLTLHNSKAIKLRIIFSIQNHLNWCFLVREYFKLYIPCVRYDCFHGEKKCVKIAVGNQLCAS